MVYNKISPKQHGFVSGRSTQTSLALLNYHVSDALKTYSQVDVINVDFAKAFDSVDHGILLSKLYTLGLSIDFLWLVRSILINRTQKIRINKVLSKSFDIGTGVPQGSHSGPLLFLCFINDIFSYINDSEILVFADDVRIFKRVTQPRDCSRLNKDLGLVCYWSRVNHLPMSIKKTNVIRFCINRTPFLFEYKIGDVTLESVYETKDLGIIIDDKFTFINHINYVVNKSIKILGFII